jgi:hypothetical protein
MVIDQLISQTKQKREEWEDDGPTLSFIKLTKHVVEEWTHAWYTISFWIEWFLEQNTPYIVFLHNKCQTAWNLSLCSYPCMWLPVLVGLPHNDMHRFKLQGIYACSYVTWWSHELHLNQTHIYKEEEKIVWIYMVRSGRPPSVKQIINAHKLYTGRPHT